MAITFGPYKLLRRIAAGGMGEVYLSVLERGGFKKQVAIKRILPGCCDRSDFAERFAAEAALSALLNHANIVQVFDHGCIEGTSYLAMELVEGPDLANLLSRCGALAPELVAEIALQLCRALAHAHQRHANGRPCGIVHGDVSPSNILITREGQVKLADFGIARLLGSAADCAGISGKLAYMSPEQARGEAPSPASDMFALGLVALEMLAGKRPRPEGSEEPLVSAIRGDHLPLWQQCSSLSADWQHLLGRLLAPKPQLRPSAAEAANFIAQKLSPCGPERLGSFLSTRPDLTAPAAFSPEPTEAAEQPVAAAFSPRRKLTLLAAMALAGVVLTGVFYLIAGNAKDQLAPRLEGVPPLPPSDLTVTSPAPTWPSAAPPPQITPEKETKTTTAAIVHPRRAGMASKKTLSDSPTAAALKLRVEGPWSLSLDRAALAANEVSLKERKAHLLEMSHHQKEARASVRLFPAAGSAWRLSVSAEPWLSIQLDGRPLGHTPRLDIALEPGEHRLRLYRQKHQLDAALYLHLPP